MKKYGLAWAGLATWICFVVAVFMYGPRSADGPAPAPVTMYAAAVLADGTPCPPPSVLQSVSIAERAGLIVLPAGQAERAVVCINELSAMGYFVLPLGADVQRWGWDPPTTGGPPASYRVSADFEMLSSNPAMEIIFVGPVDDVTIRVQAVDAVWRRSPCSLWSD